MEERCDQRVKKTGHTNLIYDRLRKMPLSGIGFACLAGLAAATDGLLVNEIPEVDTYQAVVFRSLAQLTTFIPLAIWFGWSFRAAKGESWPLLGRNVLATTALLTSFWSFRLMPLGDASTIVASSPMFATFFGCLVIGEACGVFEMTVLAATAVGIVLISKPTFLFSGQASDADTLSGTICASIASLSIGLEFVVMRKLQKTPVGVIVFWFAVLELVASMTAIVILYNVPGHSVKWPNHFSLTEWLILMGVGVNSIIGNFSMALAGQLENASNASLGRTFNIVMAYIYQVAILSQPMTWTSTLGSFIIVTGVIASAYRKLKQSRPRAFEVLAEPTRDTSESQSILAANGNKARIYESMNNN